MLKQDKHPSFTGFSSVFFDKNSHILLDNYGGRGYSILAFRVNKERKNTEICAV